MENIFIYRDDGTDEFSFNELKICLEILYPTLKIQQVDSKSVKNGILFGSYGQLNAKLFCIGGGRDMGYLKMLGEQGCEEIKKYVHSGGIYLGICAGAYFAADYIEFDLNGPIEVKGERMLKFFKGKATGPINKAFKYNTESEAMAIEIKLTNEESGTEKRSNSHYYYLNGGCNFKPYDENDKNLIIIARYTKDCLNSENEAAIVECNYGLGKCLLSGLHIEYNPNHLNKTNQNIHDNVLPKLTATTTTEGLYFLVKSLLNKLVVLNESNE